MTIKKISLSALALILVLLAVSCSNSNSFVGVWQYGESSAHTFEFKNNGEVILNAGSDYEDRGTYVLSDSYVTIYPTDEDSYEQEIEYKIIDKDHMQFANEYWIGYEWKIQWVDLYRVK